MKRKFFKFTKKWSRGIINHPDRPAKIRTTRPIFYFYMDDGAYIKIEVMEKYIKFWSSDGTMKIISHAPNVIKVEVEA